MSKLFPIPCECSKPVRVPATAAGSTVRCGCGRDVTVPSLSLLNQAAAASGLDPVRHIGWLIDHGALPGKPVCLRCGEPTSAVSVVRVEQDYMEVVEAKNGMALLWPLWLLASLFTGLHGASILMNRQQELAEAGKEVDIVLPVCVCEGCRGDLRQAPETKQLLAAVPEYNKLFQQYPRLSITQVFHQQ
jgi:hypothetical protein